MIPERILSKRTNGFITDDSIPLTNVFGHTPSECRSRQCSETRKSVLRTLPTYQQQPAASRTHIHIWPVRLGRFPPFLSSSPCAKCRGVQCQCVRCSYACLHMCNCACTNTDMLSLSKKPYVAQKRDVCLCAALCLAEKQRCEA
jgi:hypothetical protein